MRALRVPTDTLPAVAVTLEPPLPSLALLTAASAAPESTAAWATTTPWRLASRHAHPPQVPRYVPCSMSMNGNGNA